MNSRIAKGCWVLLGMFLHGCMLPRTGPASVGGKLVFLSEWDLPFNYHYNGTIVGGLSGIDYHKATGEYYVISDDRSQFGDARFYKCRIHISGTTIDSVTFTGVQPLRQANGAVYPSAKQNPALTPDPEAIRYLPNSGLLAWTSEGERIVTAQRTILVDPSINVMDSTGLLRHTLPLPPQLQMQPGNIGPRQNGVLEGLTVAPGEQHLFVSVEEPLYQDGDRAGTGDSTALLRLVKYNLVTGKPVAQYAYRADAVAHPPVPAGAFKINGVPEILYLQNNRLLVLERSFSTGRLACTIKVYEANLHKASNIHRNPSLLQKPPKHLVTKRLVLNMNNLGIFTDNIEGMTWGPLLPNGHRSLIFVSDNNFSPLEKTQFLLFEWIP